MAEQEMPTVEVDFWDVGRDRKRWREILPAHRESTAAPNFPALIAAVKRKRALASKNVDAFPHDDYGSSGVITAGDREVGRWRVVEPAVRAEEEKSGG